METALLGLELSEVLNKLKEMLLRQGFTVQTMMTGNPVIVAYREGGWFRKPKQLVLEISSLQNNVTRIDITAIITNKKKKEDFQAEEVVAEDFATAIYHNFKTLVHAHGIR
ncbi:MAG: hypothetical protein U0X76_06195 [Bacteroidia bacterium]